MTATQQPALVSVTTADPMVVVSADTHVGPTLATQLREYCPSKYLRDYDDYVERDAAYRRGLYAAAPQNYTTLEDGTVVRSFNNIKTAGHNDVHARLRDMDYDGISAEVVFHGSVNDEPIPFTEMGDPRVSNSFKNNKPKNPELATVGRHIYNEWLADFCSVSPERHVGLAQLPIWDVEASVREVEWAREAGLRGINFPAPQSWLPQYNKQHWEPLWAAAAANSMPLSTHFGTVGDADYSGVDGMACMTLEGAGMYARMVPWMIYGGVFERHPGLRLVLTEIPGRWWTSFLEDLDSNYRFANDRPVGNPKSSVARLRDVCPRLPSEYCRENVFVGASFMNRLEAEDASATGAYGNFLWGSDYPHAEGTFWFPDDWETTPMTHHAMRFAFGGLPEDHIRAMLGGNSIDVYDLDGAVLAEVAAGINALHGTDFQEQGPLLDGETVRTLAFRRNGVWD